MEYMDIISNFFPGKPVQSFGPAYTDLVFLDGLPITQADLDALQLKAAMLSRTADINQRREKALMTPFEYNGILWDTDPVSTQNIAGMMTFISAGNTSVPIAWRDHSNTTQVFTATQYTAFFNACCYWRNVVYVVSWQLKGAIQTMTSVDQIEAFDIDSAWPTTWEQVQAILAQQQAAASPPPATPPPAA